MGAGVGHNVTYTPVVLTPTYHLCIQSSNSISSREVQQLFHTLLVSNHSQSVIQSLFGSAASSHQGAADRKKEEQRKKRKKHPL